MTLYSPCISLYSTIQEWPSPQLFCKVDFFPSQAMSHRGKRELADKKKKRCVHWQGGRSTTSNRPSILSEMRGGEEGEKEEMKGAGFFPAALDHHLLKLKRRGCVKKKPLKHSNNIFSGWSLTLSLLSLCLCVNDNLFSMQMHLLCC